MSSNLCSRFCGLPAVLVAGLILCGPSRTALAGPPIEFSKPGEKPSQLVPRPKDDRPSEPFDALDRGNSLGGVVPTPPVPLPAPSEKTLEMLDRRKNWIFNNRFDDPGDKPGWEGRVETDGFELMDRRPKSVLREFYEQRASRGGTNSTRNSTGYWSEESNPSERGRFGDGTRIGPATEPRFANPFETFMPTEAGIGFPAAPQGTPPDRTRSDSVWNGALSEAFTGNRAKQNSPGLIEPFKGNPALNRIVPLGFEPVAPSLDPLGEGFNTLARPNLGEVPGAMAGPLYTAPAPPPSLGVAPGSSPGLFDEGAATFPNLSILPTVTAPSVEPARSQPRAPAALDFPTRNF